MKFISTVIIIAQSDIKYLMKVNLEQLFYESDHRCMIETLLLPPWLATFLEGLLFKDS